MLLGCSTHPVPRDASTAEASTDEDPLEGDVPAELAAASAALHSAPIVTSSDAPSARSALLVRAEPTPKPELAYLSPSRIGAAVRSHQAEFLACQALSDLESRAPGSVTVGWLVEADGSVASVQLGPSSFASHRVNECVLSVARSVSFPPSPIRTQVSWTVRFQGSPSGPLAEAGTPLGSAR
jgi:hypothetical protein